MYYLSTRDNKVKVSAAQAIKQGISEDGGLFVPDSFPVLTAEDIKTLCQCDYKQKAKKILGLILDDFTESELDSIIDKAYNAEKFSPSPAPVVKLTDTEFVLELWHGPTCAFKDMALQLLPHLTTLSIEKTKEKNNVLILVATSGDTGKAALEGFCDVPGTKILVFYPQNGVSNVQKLQMTTQKGSNVGVYGINGNFDNAQNGVKAIFADNAIINALKNKGYALSSANSINWGRLLPQIVYYISAYCDLLKNGEINIGEKINFCVPTGNFGNILAGYYAGKMGVPIAKLICASNSNNVLSQFMDDGVYDKNRQFFTTMSPSMDILISSNLERLLFDLLDKDDKKLKELMYALKTEGKYTITAQLKQKLNELFIGDFCTEEETLNQIKKSYTQSHYLSDPHTAVALSVYEKYKEKTNDKTKTVVLSTANPYKFSGAVLKALDGSGAENGDEFEIIDSLERFTGVAPPYSIKELKNKKVIYKKVIETGQMGAVTQNIPE